MKKFEFLNITVKGGFFGPSDEQSKEAEDRIEKAGLEGWELVQVIPPGFSGPMAFFFKREICSPSPGEPKRTQT